ncbi:MAG: peptide-methionine (S)-S-oxide reductase [Polaromonas sp.]|nr:peptide-methionine (S)-S-oxide reductase [Polaromonas sp.]
MRSAFNLLALAAAAGLLGWGLLGPGAATEKAVLIPPPAWAPTVSPGALETAVFAGGCFWGVQAVFQHTRGVLNAVSGYAGGARETANYSSIGTGRTGHAEVVAVSYDPKQVSYAQLLQIHFSVAHDPTQLNRQGPDTGTQYRSAVFYGNDSQKQVAERYIAQLDAAQVYPRKIVTQLTPLAAFYPAEAYHQDYATRNPNSAYIRRFDQPKIANLKTVLPALYRDTPVLVASVR